jgi:hypothetical protein
MAQSNKQPPKSTSISFDAGSPFHTSRIPCPHLLNQSRSIYSHLIEHSKSFLHVTKMGGLGRRRVIVALHLMVFEPVPRNCTCDQKCSSALPGVMGKCPRSPALSGIRTRTTQLYSRSKVLERLTRGD